MSMVGEVSGQILPYTHRALFKEQRCGADRSPHASWQVLALTSLVQCQLEAASVYTTWLEDTSYSQYTKVSR